MNKFNSGQSIGEIVVTFPKAAEVFKAYKIDYCCGGNRSLTTALKEQGLDETEILDKLNSSYEKIAKSKEQQSQAWQEATTGALVDQIINKHHAYLWKELPEIGELTTLILRVHGSVHPELSKVHKLFHTIKMELEEHLTKEETIQYPAIKKYLASEAEADLNDAVEIIAELEAEHTAAGNILKELRKITNDYKIPDDVCETFEATYTKLQELEADLFQHIHLENNILFPRLLGLKK